MNPRICFFFLGIDNKNCLYLSLAKGKSTSALRVFGFPVKDVCRLSDDA
jgi:hypothetical protein